MADLSMADRMKLASKGVARPDGSYPIRNQTDIDNAVKDWIRTGRSLTIKAWIEKRARALNLETPAALNGTAGDKPDEMAFAKSRAAA